MMKTLSTYELGLFKLDEQALLKEVHTVLEASGYKKITATPQFVYASGRIPILLVAHLDTVHSTVPKTILYDQNILWSPEGLGADDRAGVLCILRLLRKGLRPHVLFTTGEERGGTGARAAVAKIENCSVHYVIQLDRRNGHDAVFYDCDNKEFTEYVETFGFTKTTGSFSDISILCPAWGMAGVNLSCGYYNEHSKAEYLNVEDLLNTFHRVENMLLKPPAKRFKYVEKVYDTYKFDDTYYSTANYKSWKSDYTSWWDEYENSTKTFKTDISKSTPKVVKSTVDTSTHKLTVCVDPTELSYEFGGTAEFWKKYLEEFHDRLIDELDSFVWDTISDYSFSVADSLVD